MLLAIEDPVHPDAPRNEVCYVHFIKAILEIGIFAFVTLYFVLSGNSFISVFFFQEITLKPNIFNFAQVIRYFDYGITGIFALEVLVKVSVSI